MKRISYLIMLVLILLAVIGTACSQITPNTSGSNAQSLTQAGQLLVGTIKLEGTKNAVDAQEAAALLPLWQAYRQLTTSTTTAQAEMTAVVYQIQSTMTATQIQAIKSMNLNQQDLSSAISSLGVIDSGTSSSSSTSSTSTTSGGMSSAAGDPQGAGAVPQVSGDTISGGILGAEANLSSATPTPTQQASVVSTNGISVSLVTTLIDLLQKRAGALAG